MSPYYTPIHATTRRLDAGIAQTHRVKLTVLVVAGICFLAYLWQVNTLSTKGFQIKVLEKRLGALKTEIQDLELNVASEKSINKINERVKELEMVKTAQAEYVRPLGSSVALGQ